MNVIPRTKNQKAHLFPKVFPLRESKVCLVKQLKGIWMGATNLKSQSPPVLTVKSLKFLPMEMPNHLLAGIMLLGRLHPHPLHPPLNEM